jgi:cold shock CspA family protein
VNSYEHVRALVADIVGNLDTLVSASASSEEPPEWDALWLAVSDALRQCLETGNLAAFEAAFPLVSDALRACDARGREAAMPRLFGDFTRRAIAAGIDRTRFVDWFGSAELLNAKVGRKRGRVLYFKSAKGHGRILATDRTVCFVHYSAIQASGFRSLVGGQLVEFTPVFGSFNDQTGLLARDVACLPETLPGDSVDAG